MIIGAKYFSTTEMFVLPVVVHLMKKDSSRIIKSPAQEVVRMPSQTGNHSVIPAITSKVLLAVAVKRIAANAVGPIRNTTAPLKYRALFSDCFTNMRLLLEKTPIRSLLNGSLKR